MGTVWDRTAEFLSDNLTVVTPVALTAFFVPASVGGSLHNVVRGDNANISLIAELITLVLAVVQLWGMLVIIALARDGTDVHEANRIARRRLLPALATTLVSWLIVMLLFSPFILIVMLDPEAMAALAQPGMPVPLNVPAAWHAPLAIYGIAAVLALLWLSARLVLTTPVVVQEDRVLGALPRSFALTRGVTWRVVGVILLFLLVAIVSVLAATLVFGSIFRLVVGDGEGLSLAAVLTSVVSGVVQAAFTVLGAAFTAKLYLACTASEAASRA